MHSDSWGRWQQKLEVGTIAPWQRGEAVCRFTFVKIWLANIAVQWISPAIVVLFGVELELMSTAFFAEENWQKRKLSSGKCQKAEIEKI